MILPSCSTCFHKRVRHPTKCDAGVALSSASTVRINYLLLIITLMLKEVQLLTSLKPRTFRALKPPILLMVTNPGRMILRPPQMRLHVSLGFKMRISVDFSVDRSRSTNTNGPRPMRCLLRVSILGQISSGIRTFLTRLIGIGTSAAI